MRDLLGSPDPPLDAPGVSAFRASRYWIRNVRGAPLVAVTVGAFFLVIGGVLIGLTKGVPWVSVLLILTGVAWPLVLFPGKLAALYPYAAEVKGGRDLQLYTPLGKVHLTANQLKGIRWSWVYGGWVVSVNDRYGLLSGFIIHLAWGRQGRDLAQAIEKVIAHKG